MKECKIKLSRNKKNYTGRIFYNSVKKQDNIIKKIDNGIKSILDYDYKTKKGERVWSF